MKPGAEQLTDWIARRWPLSARKNREAAEHFDWDETFISMLCRGVRAPGLANAIKIERESGIPVEAWVSTELDESETVPPEKNGKRRQDRA
jgi:hypothetical protein